MGPKDQPPTDGMLIARLEGLRHVEAPSDARARCWQEIQRLLDQAPVAGRAALR